MYIVLDVGRTKTRLGISLHKDKLDKIVIFDTPHDPDQLINSIKTVLSDMTDEKPKALVLGVKGVFDETKSAIVSFPPTPSWLNKPIRQQLEKAFECSVVLENDAALAGLGEAIKGAGQGYKIISFITVGTGVGGARIVDGQIDQNSLGFEPGHQIIDVEKNLQLEDLVGGEALERRYGQKPENIKDPEIWHEVEKNLAVGIYNSITEWSPDVVVLSGGVSNNLNVGNIYKHMAEVNTIYPFLPEIKKGTLGDSAALWGGLVYLASLT